MKKTVQQIPDTGQSLLAQLVKVPNSDQSASQEQTAMEVDVSFEKHVRPVVNDVICIKLFYIIKEA